MRVAGVGDVMVRNVRQWTRGWSSPPSAQVARALGNGSRVISYGPGYGSGGSGHSHAGACATGGGARR